MFFKKAASGAVPAPPTKNESQRIDALRSYDIMDTMPEAAYDDLVLIAAAICQTPIALLSLVDDKRQWFKARIGLAAAETPRELAFCAHAILDAKPLVVEDTTQDPRFATNPLVTGDPSIRFYAGVPLVNAEGHALGTLCAIDRRPRELTTEQTSALEALSRQTMAQLELRRTVSRMQNALDGSGRAPAAAPGVLGS